MIDQVNEKNVQFVCVCVVAKSCKDMLTPSFSYYNTVYIIILYNPRESTVLHITCTCCIIYTHVYGVNINIVLLLWVETCRTCCNIINSTASLNGMYACNITCVISLLIFCTCQLVPQRW